MHRMNMNGKAKQKTDNEYYFIPPMDPVDLCSVSAFVNVRERRMSSICHPNTCFIQCLGYQAALQCRDLLPHTKMER